MPNETPVLRSLTEADFDALVTTFNEAFGDYVVPFHLTTDALRKMQTRRGYVPSASVGAFVATPSGERMVAFTLNCIDGDRGYDSGTGVVPSHRRGGLARRIMEASFAALRAHGVRNYVLEVIEANQRAAALYRSLGFTQSRHLQCWMYTGTQRRHTTELANADLDLIASWSDVSPSWQNSVASIRRANEPYVVLGHEHAALVLFPSNGDVPLLAIDPAHRRQGQARELLAAAATRANKPLRIMNVDAADEDIATFLQACRATRFVAQLEMTRSL